MRSNNERKDIRIAVIGNGTIGSAIAKLHAGAQAFGRNDDLAQVTKFEIIVIAVKPQQFEQLANQLKEHVSGQMIISVMAGVKIKTIQDDLGTMSVVRTMPNLGIASSHSLTGIFPVPDELRQITSEWGNVIELSSEEQFDSFTALAGSSPAYVFKLLACLQSEALTAGFTTDTSRLIAAGVLSSCAASLGDSDAAQRVKEVTSRGGTTEVALKVFDAKQFNTIIQQAVAAATDRSKELSK